MVKHILTGSWIKRLDDINPAGFWAGIIPISVLNSEM